MKVEIVLSLVIATCTAFYTVVNVLLWIESRRTRKQKTTPHVSAVGVERALMGVNLDEIREISNNVIPLNVLDATRTNIIHTVYIHLDGSGNVTLSNSLEDSTYYVHVSNDDGQFIWLVTVLMEGKGNLFDPHRVMISKKEIDIIWNWYEKKKKLITSDKVEKAYELLYPPKLDYLEDYERWSKEWDEFSLE